MSRQSKASRIIGLTVGLVVVVGAVYSVFFIEWDSQTPAEPEIVRPLKTMLIESPFAASARKYPGEVQANEEVALAFQVTGQLIEFPVRKGQEVAQGEYLGRLDPRNFESTLQAKQGVLTKARADLEKIEDLIKRNVANQQELVDAKATFEVADAEVKVATKALEDTRLHAPFAGVIANTHVDNFQNISAQQPVLNLQEVESIQIVVHVPEERIVRAEKGKEKDRSRLVATFEYLPGREFDVAFKEFSTEADPATQTFAATFVMPAPDDVLILPGMTATIWEYPKAPQENEAKAYAVPIGSVPIDSQGTYFVWTVKDADDEIATVHRVDVQVGEMVRNDILILAGLEQGDRIATAGVHLLQEGQRVRPFLAKGGNAP